MNILSLAVCAVFIQLKFKYGLLHNYSVFLLYLIYRIVLQIKNGFHLSILGTLVDQKHSFPPRCSPVTNQFCFSKEMQSLSILKSRSFYKLYVLLL